MNEIFQWETTSLKNMNHIYFISNVTLRCHRNGDQELDKIDFAAWVRVKCFENVAAKFISFAVWIKLFVDVDELLLVQFAFGTIFLYIDSYIEKKKKLF